MKANSPECRRELFWQNIPEVYRDLKNWPDVDEKTVDQDKVPRLRRLRKATELFLKRQPIEEVLAGAGVGERQFFHLLSSALRRLRGGAEINGTRAFVKDFVQRERQRKQPYIPASSATAGFCGLFSQLLNERPQVETDLIDFLNGKERPNKVTPRILHAKFKKIVKAHQVQADQYPLNTKSEGYRPLMNWYTTVYMPKFLNRHIRNQHGNASATAAGYEQGDGQTQTPPLPYTVWVIDEFRVDLESVIEVPMARWDVEYLELKCFPVLRCRSIGSIACNISWHMCLRKQASGADVIQLFKNAVLGQPAVPTVEPSMGYEDGAGFPQNLFPSLKYAVPILVYLDNALSHLFDPLQHLLQRLYGGRVILGIPGSPKGRPDIESSIGHLLRGLLHQLPSTTGTGPLDPVRKSAAVVPSKRVPLGLLEQALDVYMANQNVLPSASAGYLDSFTRLSRMIEAAKIKYNYLPESKRRPHHFSAPKPAPVLCDLGKGRLPYVNFMHRRYSSAWLKGQPALRGKLLWALADYDDLRTIILIDESGAAFATVTCEGQWGRVPHDLWMLRIYAKHKADAQFKSRPSDVPLFAVLAHLSSKAKGDSAAAMDLVYITRYLKRHLPPEEFQQIQDGEFNEPCFDASGESERSTPIDLSVRPEKPTLPLAQHAPIAVRGDVIRSPQRFHVPRRLQ